jgi:hypothetical protein
MDALTPTPFAATVKLSLSLSPYLMARHVNKNQPEFLVLILGRFRV